MPYRWKKNQIQDKCLVESRQFDESYSNWASVINGGIDKDNLPINCIDTDNYINQCVGSITLKDNIANPEANNYRDTNYGLGPANSNPRANRIVGLTYERDPVQSGGTFFEITNQSIDCEEGMLDIRFKVNTFIPMYWAYYAIGTTTRVALKSVQFQIRLDDVVVYEADEVCEGMFTHVLATQVPITKGNRTIRIYARVREEENETNAQVVLQYWGGQLMLHNLYR